MHNKRKRPTPQDVLFVIHPDGYVQGFGERGVNIHICRVPWAATPEGEVMAEEVALGLLPRRFRGLWRADYLRATGSTRPLLPSTVKHALDIKEVLKLLDHLPAKLQETAA
jgi:hypothetical protein